MNSRDDPSREVFCIMVHTDVVLSTGEAGAKDRTTASRIDAVDGNG